MSDDSMLLGIVGHCLRCGNPIYAQPVLGCNDQPQVRRTCLCVFPPAPCAPNGGSYRAWWPYPDICPPPRTGGGVT